MKFPILLYLTHFFIARNLSKASTELEKKMGRFSKRCWRTWYWITEIESAASTEDKILQCYKEVEEERQREMVMLRDLESFQRTEIPSEVE